jgi:hypothetical protein
MAQAVLVVIGAVALVLFVLQLTAPAPHDFGANRASPASPVATSRQ